MGTSGGYQKLPHKTGQGRGTVASGYKVVMPSSRSADDARRVLFSPPYSNAKVPMGMSDLRTKVMQHLMTRMTYQAALRLYCHALNMGGLTPPGLWCLEVLHPRDLVFRGTSSERQTQDQYETWIRLNRPPATFHSPESASTQDKLVQDATRFIFAYVKRLIFGATPPRTI